MRHLLDQPPRLVGKPEKLVRVTVLKKILEHPGLSEAWNTLVLAMHNRVGFRLRRVLGDDCPRTSRP